MPPLTIKKQDSAINFQPNLVKIASGGNHRLLSSYLWIVTMMESDLDHYQKKDLNSWMFLRFKTISTLDPMFYENYIYGGQYLSIIKDDTIGAKDIYLKGLKHFPNDFRLNLNTAFNFLFELDDIDSALVHYKRAIEKNPEFVNKNMPFLRSLVAKLQAGTGNLKMALFQAKNGLATAPKNSRLKEKFQKLVNNIQTQIDLECLNSNSSNCNQRDFNGLPYKQDEKGVYFSSSDWQKIKLPSIKRGAQRK